MAITVDESFDVAANPDEVWAYLIDPARVVGCLPGAELVEVEDAQTFVGRVKVKVGPVTASFRGRARFDELDASARRVRMSGKGQETAGAGSATMTMTSEVTPLPGGGSRVRVHAEVDVVGKLMQFGRGMMEEVSKQIFAQFASCVGASLGAAATSAGAAASTGAASSIDPVGTAAAPSSTGPQSIDALSLMGNVVRKRIGRLFGRDES
jgi:carbon monoxide dehydrogenase subunit G